MGPKWFNLEAKILQKSILEASWGLLGPRGVSYRRPGASMGRLGASWVRLGASWVRPGGVLGRLGGVLVANMAPTWLLKRSQNRYKIEAKIV